MPARSSVSCPETAPRTTDEPHLVPPLTRQQRYGRAAEPRGSGPRKLQLLAFLPPATVGIDVVSDGEMGKTSFLAYADELTGFVEVTADDSSLPSSKAGGSWAPRLEWTASREYYQEYLPRAMPRSALPAVCWGPVAYKDQALPGC